MTDCLQTLTSYPPATLIESTRVLIRWFSPASCCLAEQQGQQWASTPRRAPAHCANQLLIQHRHRHLQPRSRLCRREQGSAASSARWWPSPLLQGLSMLSAGLVSCQAELGAVRVASAARRVQSSKSE